MIATTKKRKLWDFPLELLLILISAFVYSLAFPSFISVNGYPILGLFALIPLLYAANRTKWYLSPLLGFIFGAAFLGIFNYWLKTFHPYSIFIATFLKGVELAFFFPLLKAMNNLPRKWKVLLQSLTFVAGEYAAQLGFLAYPYGSLSSVFATWLPLIQIVDIVGVWGISLLIIIPQAFIANYLNEKRLHATSFSSYLFEKEASIYIYITLLLATLIYGVHAINYWQLQTPDSTMKIAAIQHNSDTWKGGYSQYKKNFETLKSLTEASLSEDPDMVVWSETAFVPSVEWHTNYPSDYRTSYLVQQFTQFGKDLGCPLVTGNPEGVLADPTLPPFDAEGNWNRNDYNSVILFANGQLQDSYRKQHLVPFTEYFPYQKKLPTIYDLLKAHDFHWWLPGEESHVFTYDNLTFSTSICFEDIFGNISSTFTKQGSSLLLNLSNDSWSNSVTAEMQHMRLGTFRAIENRRSALRSTNSGMSCLILPWGEVVDPITPFTSDYHVYTVPIYTKKSFGLTLYSSFGDWFGLLIFSFSCITCLFLFIREIREKKVQRATEKNKQLRAELQDKESTTP